jgi:hypothetical protein
MSKSWRERIAEAEVRGEFTDEDFRTWYSVFTCPAAEVAERYGLTQHHSCLWQIGHDMTVGGRLASPSHVSFLMAKIEDLALQLKREGL